MATKVQLNVLIDKDVRQRMLDKLLNPAKGHPDRGSIATFVEEAIKRELDRSEINLEEFFNGGENTERA